jgi:RimJ/RimL family protein N-acetyltransferase
MIKLLPFGKEDFERLKGWIDSPALLLQWAGPIFQFPLDAKQLERYLADASGESSSKRIFKAVNNRGEIVGHIEISNIDLFNSSTTISRVLVNPSVHGEGIGTSMVRSILEIAFQ